MILSSPCWHNQVLWLKAGNIICPNCYVPEDESMLTGSKVVYFGISCSHAYAHTSKIAAHTLPRNLKGSDFILYSRFHSFGCEVSICPVLEEVYEVYPYQGIPETDHQEQKKTLESLDGRSKDGDGKRKGEEKRTQKLIAFVGTKLYPQTVISSCIDSDNEYDKIKRYWECDDFENIYCMTSIKHQETALTQATYGNEPSVGCKYSHAAILVKIPSWEDGQKK
ncbi:hypothetical protein TSTA_065160 [Talaromyces stipitatus ATCC 10500]|uniref:Uncharacterized protein n=1 Tax=Talaromyces stipitatus (strain ATCC 10500 / CBS 375.48 / QM 6759 / NRRL 1006) TaxID=441959 RepID=B8LTI0_TALSN|nr:uncharacterized protein TSTA_065160 [Talaromyces stipitatus ATCC 10500]EED23057.1 hypothetical protein TSTA_065160 [Talaromyces stipitatus ATCC 10500]